MEVTYEQDKYYIATFVGSREYILVRGEQISSYRHIDIISGPFDKPTDANDELRELRQMMSFS